MHSTILFEGYGKVSNLEVEDEQPPFQKPSYSATHNKAVAVSAILLSTLIIGLLVVALISKTNTETHQLSSSIVESIRTVCQVTRYPDSCVSSLSSSASNLEKADPETIFKISLQTCTGELSDVYSFLKSLLGNLNDYRSRGALSECQSLLNDALHRLKDALSATEIRQGEMALTERKISDIQTWISSAMTDQETCLDGLEEMGSTAVEEVKARMDRSKKFLSNSLAIIENIQALRHKFGMCMP